MTNLEKREYKLLKNERFCYVYNNSEDMLKDFEKWMAIANAKTAKVAKQTVTNLREIWLKVDSGLELYPINKLSSLNAIEDNFFLPLYIKIRENSKKNIKDKHLKPSTIMGKLASIRSLMDFAVSRDIFIGKG